MKTLQASLFREPATCTANDEYYTPPKYLEAVRSVFGGRIDLDPASCLVANQIVRAADYYTASENGLEQDWCGSVYCNPPYSKIGGKSQTRIWFDKLLTEYRSGRVTQGILLCNVSTGSLWFRPLLEHSLICFVSPRIAFVDAHGRAATSPRYDNVFCYVGPHSEAFRAEFSAFGSIMRGAS